MESKNAPVAIAGAALAAFLLAPLGNRLVTIPSASPQLSPVAAQPAKPVEGAGPLRSTGLMRDDTGPGMQSAKSSPARSLTVRTSLSHQRLWN